MRSRKLQRQRRATHSSDVQHSILHLSSVPGRRRWTFQIDRLLISYPSSGRVFQVFIFVGQDLQEIGILIGFII
jgi:hypothetical protein